MSLKPLEYNYFGGSDNGGFGKVRMHCTLLHIIVCKIDASRQFAVVVF